MSYVQTNWKNGDIITAEALNHIEQGVANANGALIITVETEECPDSAHGDTHMVADVTWQEVYDAISQGRICAAIMDTPPEAVFEIFLGVNIVLFAGKILEDNTQYDGYVYVVQLMDSTVLWAPSPNEYLVDKPCTDR